MAELNSNRRHRLFFKLLAAGYGLLVAFAVALLEPLAAGVVFLSLQCISLVFTVPAYLDRPSRARTLPKRFAGRMMCFLRPACLLGAGAAAAFASSFVTALPVSHIVLASLFALAFGIFLAGVSCILHVLPIGRVAQALALVVGLLMVSTPYYVNPFIIATSGALRMRVVQLSVSINPLLVGAAGIMNFDWLRASHLYQTCLVGGYQYPFYYPSALKVGIIFALAGIILIGISALRKAGESEARD